jgi:hypothetical protein
MPTVSHAYPCGHRSSALAHGSCGKKCSLRVHCNSCGDRPFTEFVIGGDAFSMSKRKNLNKPFETDGGDIC